MQIHVLTVQLASLHLNPQENLILSKFPLAFFTPPHAQ